jgi:DNA-binding response OmpR family regulator
VGPIDTSRVACGQDVSVMPEILLPERRILVVEDELLIGLDVRATLLSVGCVVVGPIQTVDAAVRTVRTDPIDAAVLDINLGGDLSFPIADALAEANVPYLFLTAHARVNLPEPYSNQTVIAKPFSPSVLLQGLAGIFV